MGSLMQSNSSQLIAFRTPKTQQFRPRAGAHCLYDHETMTIRKHMTKARGFAIQPLAVHARKHPKCILPHMVDRRLQLARLLAVGPFKGTSSLQTRSCCEV